MKNVCVCFFFFFLFEGGEGLKHDVYCWAKILEGQAFRKIDYLIIYYCHFLPYELLCLSVFFLFLLVYYPLWLLLLIDKIVCCILQIMIGILFFLFEFYDDQLLAFMVLILVWLCELFTLIRSLSLSLSMIYVYIYIYIYYVCLCMCICIYTCINIIYLFVFLYKSPTNIIILGLCLQCPHSYIDEVFSSLLFALFSGFPHLFLFLCLW